MQQKKYKQKTLKELGLLFDAEKPMLLKYNRYNKILSLLGLFFCIVSTLESIEPHWPLPIITAIGIIGGLFIGLGIMFYNAAIQWPIIKPLINKDALKEAQKNADL